MVKVKVASNWMLGAPYLSSGFPARHAVLSASMPVPHMKSNHTSMHISNASALNTKRKENLTLLCQVIKIGIEKTWVHPKFECIPSFSLLVQHLTM